MRPAIAVGILLLSSALYVWAAEATVDQAASKPKKTLTPALVGLVVTLLLLDQLNYRRKKQALPGPKWTIPFIGYFWDSVHPKFDKYMAQWNLGPLSCTSVFQKFIVIGSNTEVSRKIFNTPGQLIPCLVAAMKDILTPENFVFLQGKVHADYRRGLNPLFTRSALGLYLPRQQKTYERYISEWLALGGEAVPYQTRSRELNMETSLVVFCGEYMDVETRKKISQKYYAVTKALQLVNFPLAIPGTNVWAAIQARKFVVARISEAAQKSRTRMESGAEANCLLDAWMKHIIKEKSEWEQGLKDSDTPPQQYSDNDIALTVLTFIFASQDASTSSVTWALTLLAEHPDVLAKVREEQKRVRGNNELITPELLDKMPYLRQVAKEILRYRPPVIMVPYEARHDCQLSKDYVVKQGTIVVPSIWPTQHDPAAYKNPDQFDPDRFGPDRAEDVKSPQHWLVFGHGPHMCLGKDYAMNHLMAFIAVMATTCNWERIRTEKSDEIRVFATIYPADECILKVTPIH